MTNPITIAIHGGAGTILKSSLTPQLEDEYTESLKQSLNAGYQILKQGGTSLDAVEASVVSLENCYLFNAGRGAVFNSIGKHEMDASIMEGQYLKAGAVSSVQNIKNPVKLAMAVMEQSEHVFLTAAGAMQFAKERNIELAPDDYFFVQNRYDQWQSVKDTDQYNLDHVDQPSNKKFGTVGAVALDIYGNLAAATSTGGRTNKWDGRIGECACADGL